MKSKVYVGAGYRELDTNEIVQAGDEYYACNVWSKTNCAGESVSAAGRLPDGSQLTYRRKVSAVRSNVEVGDGYRELRPDEILQKDDEHLSLAGMWRKTVCVGDTVLVGGSNGFGEFIGKYRRKLIEPGPGYRILAVGETVQESDEWRCDGRWLKTNMQGHAIEADDGCPYRRMVPVQVEIGVGSGYRELDSWEVLQAGDEYLSCNLYWEPVSRIGFLPFSTLKYRRLSPPVHPAWRDAPYTVEDTGPGCGYRWVRPGETILPADEVQTYLPGQPWNETCRVGEVVASNELYRRKLTPGYTQSYGGSCGKIPVVDQKPKYVESLDSNPARYKFDGTEWIHIPDNGPKPPLGLMPRSIWLKTRRDEVLAAIRRYADAGIVVPSEWLTEYFNP